MGDSTPKSYHLDPTLYLYTSLSSGSSAIITATSRMETILKAKKVPFQALDVATDEKARMLWSRRAGKRKLPGLVKQGMIVGDIGEVEEWNEYGELMEHLGDTKGQEPPTMTSSSNTPTKMPTQPTPSALKEPAPTPADGNKSETPNDQLPTTPSTPAKPAQENTLTAAMQNIGFEAAQKAKAAKASKLKSSTESPSVSEPPKETTELRKLDNAGPTGMPPPSGITDAESAKAPETAEADVVSKGDDTSISSPNVETKSAEIPDTQLPKEITAKAEEAMALSAADAVAEAAPVVESSVNDPPARKEEMTKVAQTKQDDGTEQVTEEAATAADESQTPVSGTKTQEQPAAKAEAAQESVGD